MLQNKMSFINYQDWTKRTANKLVSIDFVRFSIVGASGFIVNTIFLTLFYKLLHLPLLFSQIIAAEMALISNFTLHNLWTYRNSLGDRSWFKKLVIFHGSSWSGILITTIVLLAVVDFLHKNYIFGLISGSAVAMFWNFTWTKYLIFKKQK